MRSPITSLEEVLTEVAALFELSNERVVLAIIGKPGAGKSTITDHIFKNIAAEDAVLVPMDGYHLSNRILANLALEDRKGAPETFDAQSWAFGSDERNAVIIGETKKLASRIVALENRLEC